MKKFPKSPCDNCKKKVHVRLIQSLEPLLEFCQKCSKSYFDAYIASGIEDKFLRNWMAQQTTKKLILRDWMVQQTTKKLMKTDDKIMKRIKEKQLKESHETK